jgi:predicted ATP-binding protein involved in virulence
MNVLIGENGAGKSTILDALSILLSWLPARIKSPQGRGAYPKESDIENGKRDCFLIVFTERNDTVRNWVLSKARAGREKVEVNSLASLTALTDQFLLKDEDQIASYPLVAHYAVNRAVLDIPLRIRAHHDFQPLDAFDQSLSGADFRQFFEWFRNQEDIENEQYAKGNRKANYKPDHQLSAVRSAIQNLTGFEDLRVIRSPYQRMELRKKNETLQIDQLSDGEKCLLAMVGDLARRLALANPGLENPLDGYGIVLIDEIELHLHPKWQKMIIPKLRETFPNCQFIVSTHSPLVLSYVSSEKIILLKNNQVEQVNWSFGQSVERIVEDIMDVPARPEEIQEKLSELYRKIKDADIGAAKAAYEELRKELGDDPGLVQADFFIRRKENAPQ